MIERTATIRNAQGIRCRPSAVIVQAVLGYRGEAALLSDAGECDLRSLFPLVSLGLEQGMQVRIRVSGPGEEAFCARLVELFETNFDFEPLSGADGEFSVEAFLSGRR